MVDINARIGAKKRGKQGKRGRERMSQSTRKRRRI